MLHNPYPVRERALLIGAWKSGKTSACLSIAKALHDTGSDARMYVIETEPSWAKYLLLPSSPFHDLPNVEYSPVTRWPEYTEVMNKYLSVAREQDWIVLDSATAAWQAVQAYYYEEAYGKTIEEVLMGRKKKQAASGQEDGNEGMRDYQTINPIYFRFILPWANGRSNIIATAQEKSVGYREAKSTTDMFGKETVAEGAKPDAQKDLAYQVDTVLRFRAAIPGKDYRVTTIGDRGNRELWVGRQVVDFGIEWLTQSCGWKM